MLFSFENMYGIFRPQTENNNKPKKSEYYELKYVRSHDSVVPDDVLKDILYLVRSGEITMLINDIVSIKINGTISDYRYLGYRSKNPEQSFNNFAVTKGFLTDEKKYYILNLHKSNKVLSVLDGKVYSVNDSRLSTRTFFCIDREVFQSPDRAAQITSDYFLYTLQNFNIKEVNPYRKPFGTVKHALYYYFKNQKSNADAILLLNRHELEMVKDYCELHAFTV
jgi:hypothetical protein